MPDAITMYGCSQEQVITSKPENYSAAMWATSLLSDVQEVMAFASNLEPASRQETLEQARLLVNQAKYWINHPLPRVSTAEAAGIPESTIFVRDDMGLAWYFNGRLIKAVNDDTPDGGYFCDSLEEGVKMLNDYGYIAVGTEGE